MKSSRLPSIVRRVPLALVAAIFLGVIPAFASIAIDANVSVNQNSAKTTITSPALSTTAGNELLLAFVSADFLSGTNTQVSSVSGGGLTWTLVVRTNAQKGTSEIWRAFAIAPLSQATVVATLSHSVLSSLTVLSFTGVNTSGTGGAGAIGAIQSGSAAKGAPTASLVTTLSGSWVFGVGNDWDNAVARTLGAGQSLVHQDLSSSGDTYWVQMEATPTPLSGTTVTINDTAPTGDRYNLSIVEVVAASGGGSLSSISGTLSPSALVSGTSIVLGLPGGGTVTATPDGSGSYSFSDLANGSYTVTPNKSGQTFTPPSQNISIAGSSISGVNFALQTWGIAGTVSPASASSGTTIMLSGSASASTSPDGSGNYTFSDLPNGTYSVTPSNSGFTFNPANQPVSISSANVNGINFSATANPTWSISGTITPPNLGANVLLTLSGSGTGTVNADGTGNYIFNNLANGSYTITPSQASEAFTPGSQPVMLSGASQTGVNFAAQASTVGTLAIDSSVSVDTTAKAAAATIPSFSTTSGNELLLAFVAADYLSGNNTTVTGVTGGSLTWVLVQRTNVQSGTAEIWRAFAPNPLPNVSITAALSQKVLSSITLVSFTGVDISGSNGSGAIGATASQNAATGAPSATLVTTRNNSWVFGVGDDFDNAVARTLGSGQTMVHQDLSSSGDTYWVQRQTKTTPIIGTEVTINDTAPKTDRYDLSLVEVLPNAGGPPPTVNMTSPLPFGTVTGITTISATAASSGSPITGVQFQLDGENLGSQVASVPYSLVWDTTGVSSGAHTLSAIAYNSLGLSAISNTNTVTVDNSGNLPIAGSWSISVNLPAVAVNLILTKNNTLLFYQDGSTPTIWDYQNNLFTSIPAPADLFCSGHAELADGRILVVGGYGEKSNQMGISNAEMFDPASDTWTVLPKMAYSRWYPTAKTLSDGRIIVMGGWQTAEHTNAGIPEIYDPSNNTWTQLTAANNPFETYPFIYQLSDGRIVHVNGSEYPTTTDILNFNTLTWSTVDSAIKDGGSSVMYMPDVIMKAGSATDSQESGASANTTYVLDMTQPAPSWKQTASMAYPRSFLNLTELPDGTVLATGGETDKNGGNIGNAVYPAELWSPVTQTWTTMSAMHTPREYHGTALLLPDGRVLESGMGADFGNVPNELSAEFFSPPYLFKGPRPTVTQSPSQISYGQSFFVGTPDGATIKSAVLIRTGAVTHFFDMNTQFVPVTFQQAAGGLTLTAPANGNLAPPGYYMLFLVNSNGVPSVAPFVQLQ
ncbi:MAG TPA: galactose oxidase-like domain-containing protein [Terriglobales bacterium]|nr:galactose oxidase-like domain-containing protein [Terriglobales bacterium]